MNILAQLLLLGVLQNPAAAIDRICQREIDSGRGPGLSVAVVKNGKVLHRAGYGLADIENQTPATPDTAFRVGSVTKQFTAMAVQILEEEGKLSIDDFLSDRLPPFPPGKRITLRHMLTHTSGFNSLREEKHPPWAPGGIPTSREIVEFIGSRPLAYSPGENFSYGNPQYILAGLVVEAVTGSTLAAFLEERIFTPLEMNATEFGNAGDRLPFHAVGYEKDKAAKKWVPAPVDSMILAGGAGGMTSTANDLAKWAQALQAQRFLSPEGYRKMATRVILKDGTVEDYGLGWRLSDHKGQLLVAHGGGASGYSAYIGCLIDERLAIVILTNGVNSGGRSLFNKIAEVVMN